LIAPIPTRERQFEQTALGQAELDSLSEEATVDDDVFARDKATGVWSGHQHDSSGKFLWYSEWATRIVAKFSARRSMVADAFDSFRRKNFAILFSWEEAR